MMSCSRNRKVLLWSTLWRTCTWATHKWGVYVFLQSPHCWFAITNSTTKLCWRSVPLRTSFCTVSFTLIRFEWGSVHTKPASTSLTRLSPFTCFRQIAKSSPDSRWAWVQGGLKYRLHSRQCCIINCLGMPSVISIWDLRQLMQVFDWLGTINIPQMQQRLSYLSEWKRFLHLVSLEEGRV